MISGFSHENPEGVSAHVSLPKRSSVLSKEKDSQTGKSQEASVVLSWGPFWPFVQCYPQYIQHSPCSLTDIELQILGLTIDLMQM